MRWVERTRSSLLQVFAFGDVRQSNTDLDPDDGGESVLNLLAGFSRFTEGYLREYRTE